MTHLKEIAETPTGWVLEDMKGTKCRGWHESLLFSHRVLRHVKDMLVRKDSQETILEMIATLETMQEMISPPDYVVKNHEE